MLRAIMRYSQLTLGTGLAFTAASLFWLAQAQAGVIVTPPDDPRSYDFEVSATVTKNKDTFVAESIQRNKDIIIDVQVMSVAAQFSEALSMLMQGNTGELYGALTARSDSIADSAIGNSGMTVVNQTSGNSNNQGSSSSVAATTEPNGQIFSEAQAAVGQVNGAVIAEDNEDGEGEDILALFALSGYIDQALTENATSRTATISNSVRDNDGLTHINQATGNANNQGNATALAMGIGAGGVLLNDAVLGQANLALSITEFAVERSVIVVSSIVANTGVVGVNQAGGNFANQANVVANGIAILNTAVP